MHTLRKQSYQTVLFALLYLQCVYILPGNLSKIFSSTQLDLNTLNSNKIYKPFYFLPFIIPSQMK